MIEVLQKEKKQKEEKTVPLGQAVLDLLPLLQGTTWTSTASVNASCSLPLLIFAHGLRIINNLLLTKIDFLVFRKLGLKGRGDGSSSSAVGVVAAQL